MIYMLSSCCFCKCRYDNCTSLLSLVDLMNDLCISKSVYNNFVALHISKRHLLHFQAIYFEEGSFIIKILELTDNLEFFWNILIIIDSFSFFKKRRFCVTTTEAKRDMYFKRRILNVSKLLKKIYLCLIWLNTPNKRTNRSICSPIMTIVFWMVVLMTRTSA